jgi:hypothetical protein
MPRGDQQCCLPEFNGLQPQVSSMSVFRLSQRVEPRSPCHSDIEQAVIMERPQRFFSADGRRLDRHIDELRFDTAGPERLPWPVAVPLIGGISIGLWFGLWKLAVFALHG